MSDASVSDSSASDSVKSRESKSATSTQDVKEKLGKGILWDNRVMPKVVAEAANATEAANGAIY